MNHGGIRTPRSAHRSRAAARRRVLLVALIALGASVLPGLARASPPQPLGLGLAVSAQPVQGTVPLLVAFRATLTPSATTATFDWSFGDGSSYSESATGYSAVEHAYDAPGAFIARIFVASPSGDANATVVVQASPDTLATAISATPLTGTAPLTVHFQALPYGGTGTYAAILWQFGDGDNGSGADLAYTYARAGDFNATLNVTDSAGASALAYVEIHVAAGSTPSRSSGDSGAIGPSWALPLAVGLVALAIVLGAIRWALRRPAATSTLPPPPPPRAPVLTSTGTAPAGPPTPEAMEQAATVPLRGVEESRRLSERLLVHLYWYGRGGTEGVATLDASQAGMARRFGVTQNAVSKALQRLVEAGTVTVQLRHVPGASRRLKTYALTPRGEAIARTLRVERDPRPKG